VVIQNVDQGFGRLVSAWSKAGGILVSEVQDRIPQPTPLASSRATSFMRLNDVELKDVSDLRNRVAMLSPGTTAVLLVIRDGQGEKDSGDHRRAAG
jgi:serine protease Do